MDMITMVKAWNDNQDIIQEHLSGKTREGYQDQDKDKKLVLGFSIGIFIFVFLLTIVIFGIALYVLLVNWKKLPDAAKVLGLISLFFFPIITIIIVYVAKKD